MPVVAHLSVLSHLFVLSHLSDESVLSHLSVVSHLPVISRLSVLCKLSVLSASVPVGVSCWPPIGFPVYQLCQTVLHLAANVCNNSKNVHQRYEQHIQLMVNDIERH